MARRLIRTPTAPAAIGPYSQAVRVDSMLFVSGQIGLDPATGAIVAGTVADETRQVLANLRAVITAGGARLGDVVKTTIYLTSIEDFAVVNELYGQTFADVLPARATVEVSALPKGARVEIDAIALIKDAADAT